MSIVLIDPTGLLANTRREGRESLKDLRGKRAGFVFNQHATGVAFWRALESEVQKSFAPSGVDRVYKDNTWAPAAQTELDRLIRETDYVLVGLGA